MICFTKRGKVGRLVVWLVVAACGWLQTTAAASSAAPKPTRIVTGYALTATHDYPYHDPTAWRLLGSNDDGQSWTLLDQHTNHQFNTRSERQVFRISNRKPFNIYRLEIDHANWQDLNELTLDKSVQLADIELIGPLTGPAGEVELAPFVTSTQAHLLIGPPENAFDNDLTTRWLDFGLAHSNRCWIQCQYGGRSSVRLTTIGQLQNLARVAAANEGWAENGPSILSNLTAYARRPLQSLNAYAITAANDIPGRDPRDWRVLGSGDQGRTWKLLDQRRGVTFTDRFQRRVFTLTNQAAFAWYRLEIDATRLPGNHVQLAEFEPLPWKKGTTGLTLVISAQNDNPPMEAIDMAFDGDPKTKWLSFSSAETNQPNWIQWQFIPAQEDLPLLNRSQIDRWAENQQAGILLERAGKPVRTLTGYALTSANDWPSRDPRDWRLWGSRDEGQNWELLDTRRNERFPERFQRRAFSLSPPAAYPLYRLQIDSVAQPAEANSVQLAELEPLYPAGDTNSNQIVLTSVQGENPPAETAQDAFDHSPKTKWLDFADNTNRASWIEWRYTDSGAAPAPAYDLDRLRAARRRVPNRTEVSLEAVVVSYNAASNWIALIDSTGFQCFELGRAVSVQPGQKVRLAGQVLPGREVPRIPHPEVVSLGLLPVASEDFGAATRFPPDSLGLSACVIGKAATVSPGQHYCTVRLTAENGSSRFQARILDGKHLPLPSSLDCRLRISGVIEPAFNEKGERVPGILWAPGPEAVELAPPTEQEWTQWPAQSLSALAHANYPWAQLVRVRGTVVSQQPGQSLRLKQGTNQVVVYSRNQSLLPIGAEAEAAGFFVNEDATLVLRLAQFRPAPLSPVPAPIPNLAAQGTNETITQWRQMRQIIKEKPSLQFNVRLRGTITFIDLGLADFYLQNGTESIQCSGQFNAGLSPFMGQEASYVELEGAVRQGVLYPTAFATVLGKGQLPRPLRHSWDYLMGGKDDGLWVQVEGLVSAVEKQRLTLKVPGGQLIVWINDLERIAQKTLLGSLIRANGVCSPVFNSRRQRLGLRLLVPNGECLELVNAAPEDPFKLPSVPIGRVMGSDPDNPELPTQLIRTAGVVTYRQPGLLVIQDGADGLRVNLHHDVAVEPGERVEVVGLPEPDGFSPMLTQAVVRRLGLATMPSAEPIDLLDVDSAGLQEQRDATRARLDAILVAVRSSENLRVLELQHDPTRQTFSAFLPKITSPTPALLPGSHLRLQGVFKARRDAVPDVDQPVTSFEMYLNTPADIEVLSRPSWWTARRTAWVLGGLGAVLLLALAWVGSLRNQVCQRTHELHEEIEDRKRTQAQLETEMAQRERMQAQVEKTHKELVAASRQAGMAEVATSVLHNVGNVLNSVNVSASLLQEKIKKSKAPNLLKAAAMVREHQNDLPEFFTHDPKGRQLPTYLVQVAEHMAGEQAEAQREVQELTKNVEHIKDIVAMQQSYARVSGVAEQVHLPDLAEDALRMNAGALQRHDVKVERHYAPDLPPITVDKHKVLQVLVNLIRNAKYACDEAGRPDKCLTIRVSRADDRLAVVVSDNGIGIPQENLTRIFNYGFTTRKNGHGFGLHSGALAAKEMGGTLQAQSQGPGQGATFTLELPLTHKP